MNYNTFQIQEGKRGIPFKNIAIVKTPNTTKWFGKLERNHYYHVFRYIDGSGIFAVELDYNGNIVKKLTHAETLEIL